MPHPKPEAGLVLGYRYLWKDEADNGAAEGRKDRPCAIIVSTTNQENEDIVMVLPITHTKPAQCDGVEIPHATAQRLGLDDLQSWIITCELNKFVWPGPDLRPVSSENPERYDYGFLPPKFYEKVKQHLLLTLQNKKLETVSRTE